MPKQQAFDPLAFIEEIARVSRTDGLMPDPDTGIGRECYAFSQQERDAQRLAERAARHILRNRVEERDYEIQRDALGSLFVTYFGSDRTLLPFMVHSHLDSVQNGGKYDGVAGIAAALGILQDVARSSPVRSLRIGVYVSEESSPRNGYGCLGSSVATGTISKEKINSIVYTDNEKLSSLFSDLRWTHVLREIDNPIITRGNTAGSVEVHIEQSTVIAGSGQAVGIVVDGIGGACRKKIAITLAPQRIPIANSYDLHTLAFYGCSDHTGGTPPNPTYFHDGPLYRKDALVACCHMLQELLRYPMSYLVRSEHARESGFTAVPSHQIADIAIPAEFRAEAFACIRLLQEVVVDKFGVRMTHAVHTLPDGASGVPRLISRKYLNIPRFVSALASKAFWREQAPFGTTRATVTDFQLTPGHLSFKLDLREVNHADFEALTRSIDARMKRALNGHEFVHVSQKQSQPVDTELTRELKQAADDLGISYIEMPSVAGQDSDRHAAARIPVGMIFIRQEDGISHSPDERMEPQHFYSAYAVASEFVRRILRQ